MSLDENERMENLRQYIFHRSQNRKYYRVTPKKKEHPDSMEGLFWLTDQEVEDIKRSEWNRRIKPALVYDAVTNTAYGVLAMDKRLESLKTVHIVL